jgi:hypothetical protein
MKPVAILAFLAALPLSAATISLSPSTPKAGDSVVVTIHDGGSSICSLSTVLSAKLVDQTLKVEIVATPAGCTLGCPASEAAVYTTPAITLPEAKPYTIEYAYTNCNLVRTVVATKQILVRPSCAFDGSFTVARTTSNALAFTWCDPSFSAFPDTGEFATAYRIFVVRDGEAPILVQEQSADKTSATVRLSDREAGAKSAFVEAVLCNETVAGCRDSFTLDSNVVPLEAPFDDCSFGGAALCLGGRFSVTARFHTAAGSSPAHTVPMTKDSGYFWFFGPDNAEVTVKIVDACSLSGKFWFFAAGMTDVGVDLVVQDTQTRQVQRYSSPAGKPFQPVLDTSAFTCP